MSRGFCSGVLGNHWAPACAVTVLSCSMAAGRYTSAETVSTFFLRRSIRCLASLAVVVVLPAPCRPAIRMIAGGWAARLMSETPSPMVAASSFWTMETSTWPGLSEPTTSWPRAFSLTRAMKSRTTGRATSASSRAMRTSRSMSWTLVSVMRAWPRMVLTRRDRRSVRFEAIGGCAPEGWGRGAAGRAPVHCGDDFIRRPRVVPGPADHGRVPRGRTASDARAALAGAGPDRGLDPARTGAADRCGPARRRRASPGFRAGAVLHPVAGAAGARPGEPVAAAGPGAPRAGLVCRRCGAAGLAVPGRSAGGGPLALGAAALGAGPELLRPVRCRGAARADARPGRPAAAPQGAGRGAGAGHAAAQARAPDLPFLRGRPRGADGGPAVRAGLAQLAVAGPQDR